VPIGILCSEFRSALGAGEARTRLGLAPDAATVTCLAMLRPEKNHSLLIEATHMVLERVPGAWLILAGEGPERQRLERQVASMNMAARVRYLGSRSDVADILAATTVSTLASRYEGLSNTVIESMCAGVPVVITDYPGASDLVRDGENGYVIPRGDARTLADRLTRLLRHPEERDGMGRRGRDLAAGRFGLESMARGLLSVYRSYGATA
jgi:glycosyltransferase involved in cell wall biosynthesis